MSKKFPPRIGVAVALCCVLAAAAGCGSSKSNASATTSGMTFAPVSTTLPAEDRLLTVGDLGGKWQSAGKVDYQSFYGDQPQQCFYDLDQLDSGATATSGASFKVGESLPLLTQVVFSFQKGAAEPAVNAVASDLDGCGSFTLPVAGGEVQGSVAQTKLDLRGLADVNVYLIDYHDATHTQKGMIMIGRQDDSVLLVILGTGSTQVDQETARQVFQVAIDKFTTGQVHNEDRITA